MSQTNEPPAPPAPPATTPAPAPPASAGAAAAESLLERRAAGFAPEELVSDLRGLPFSALFPVGAWLADRPWNLLWVRWFLFFAFFPLLLGALLGSDLTLNKVAWGYGLYFAVLWAVLLHLCLRPERVPVRRTIGIFLFTVMIGIPLLFAAQKLPIVRTLYTASDSVSLVPRALGYILGVGLIEEATKAFPLYWLFLHQKKPAGLREIIFLGAISGLAFGVAEAVNYSFRYAVYTEFDLMGYGDYILTQLLRFISLPLLHALWAAVVAYFIGLAMHAPQRKNALLIVGLGAMAIVHGVYDVFATLRSVALSNWGTLAIAAVSGLIFVGYARSGERALAPLRATAR